MRILDNHSALINYKNRNGLNIKQSNTVSIYILEKQVKKTIKNLLSTRITDDLKLNITTDKLIEKCYSYAHLIAVQKMLEEHGEEKIGELIMQGIKKFMKEHKPYLLEEQKNEKKKEKDMYLDSDSDDIDI